MQVSLQAFLAKAPVHIVRLYFAPKGLRHRQVRNMFARINGHEPEPGAGAGVKRRARAIRRGA